MYKIEIRKGRRWYWRIVAENGKVLAHSENYSSRSMARKGVASLIRLIDQDDYRIVTSRGGGI